MRIFVQVLHIGMSGCAIEVKVIFLDVLTVVSLTICQSEHTLLENRVISIPQCHAKAKQLMVIADTCETILTPVIGARPGLVMSEVVPGVPILTVVFAYCAPLPLAKIGSPFSPRRVFGAGFFKSGRFRIAWHISSPV